jgi:hypothetical protein
MELVPSLVLNTAVTFGGLLFWLATIPIRRVPVLRDPGRRLSAREQTDGEKTQEQEDDQRRVAGDAA